MIGWLFTWLITIAGTSAGWLYPFFGLMIYYLLAILRPPFLWFWSFNPFDPPRLSFFVAISTLFGWLIDGFGDWRGLKFISIPMFGLFLYLLSGTIAWQYEPVYAPIAWEFLSNQLKIGLMALITITLLHTEDRVKIFGWVIAAGMGYLGWVFNQWYRIDPVYLYRNGWGGIDNNGTAMVMVMGVPVAFFMAINEKRTWIRALLFLAVALQVHVVLFSFSRGGQLGLIMVGATLFVVALVTLPKKWLTVGAGIFFVWMALWLAGAEVRERFMTIWVDKNELDSSAASRYDTWRAGWNCILDHPLGVGPRNFNLISDQYGLPGDKSIHNLFLQTGADYGILGAIGLYTFYIGSAATCFFTSLNRTARRLVWPRYYCQMVTVSMAGFLVCSMFIGMESVEAGYIICLLGLCTSAYVRRVSTAEPSTVSGKPPELELVPERGEPLPAFA